MRSTAACILLVAAACGGGHGTSSHQTPDAGQDAQAASAPDLQQASPVMPSHGSAFGHYSVNVTFADLDGGLPPDGVSLSFGSQVNDAGSPLLTYNQTVTANSIAATVQGGPVAGPTEVALWVNGQKVRSLMGAFSYDPPQHPTPRWLAIGASMTMGVQSRGLWPDSQVKGPIA